MGFPSLARLFGRNDATDGANSDQRSGSVEDPSTALSATVLDALGVRPTDSGVSVSVDGSLAITAVYACVRVIAEGVGSIPALVYERLPGGGRQRVDDHPVADLVHHDPNDYQTPSTFFETVTANACLWGNGFAVIGRDAGDGGALPTSLSPLRSSEMEIVEVDGAPRFRRRADRKGILASNIIHVPAMSLDGVAGLSPIRVARQAAGLALAAEKFGAKFFGQGINPSGVLEHPAKLGEDAANNLATSFAAVYGGLDNSHKTPVLEEGLTFKSITIPPEDAQFLQTRRFQVEEIARLFRVPRHMVADLERATFSNIEHQALEFVTHTLRPWLKRWEAELTRKLFTTEERRKYFVEFQIDALLRGDIKTRFDAYSTALQNGILSIDEVRALENRNPLENGAGSVHLIPLNMQPAKSEDELEADLDADDRSASPPTEPDEFDRRSEIVSDFAPLLADAMKRLSHRWTTAADRAMKSAGIESGHHWPDFREWRDGYLSDAQRIASLGAVVEPAIAAALRKLGVGEDLSNEHARALVCRVCEVAFAAADDAAFELRSIIATALAWSASASLLRWHRRDCERDACRPLDGRTFKPGDVLLRLPIGDDGLGKPTGTRDVTQAPISKLCRCEITIEDSSE